MIPATEDCFRLIHVKQLRRGINSLFNFNLLKHAKKLRLATKTTTTTPPNSSPRFQIEHILSVTSDYDD